MKEKILIVEDEFIVANDLKITLIKAGYQVCGIAASVVQARQLIEAKKPNWVLLDIILKDDLTGIDLAWELLDSKIPFLYISANTNHTILEAVKETRPYGFLVKPFREKDLLVMLDIARYKYQIEIENSEKINIENTGNKVHFIDGIIGKSQKLLDLFHKLAIVAPTDTSVIITGESGTGKESVAKTIHLNSSRSDKPFIAMDCGSLTKELAGSEFFGHEKGSFTGALYTKIGHFEMANGGTLFLDEVGNLSYEIQAALLRTVQERKVKRIGSTKEIDLDVRIIVATNENLIDAISKGKFREDLYHRFNEFGIYMPPLRERGKDIMIFAEYFMISANNELNKSVKGFSAEVEESFLTYPWPGNVRELKNVLRRAVLLTEGDFIQTKALPLEISTYAKVSAFENAVETVTNSGGKDRKVDLKNAAQEAEYDAILKVLKEVKFNKTKAAKLLNIDRKTLYNKMKAINLE